MIDDTKIDKEKVRAHLGGLLRELEAEKAPQKYRADFLEIAMACGAILTGKPDGTEPIEVHFTIPAWRRFDLATRTY